MREVTPGSPFAIFLILLVLGYAGVLVIAPIYAIVDTVFADGISPVRESLQHPDVRHAIQLSFQLALAAAAFNTVFGVLVAWVLERHQFVGRGVLDALIDIPFVFAPVIAGYVMIVLFGRGGWVKPPFAIVFALPGMFLAKVFVTLPFVIRETAPVIASIPPQQEEAAYTLGAGRWRTFWRIVMPMIWAAVLYGMVLAFARAIGEFGAVIVVSGRIEGQMETATLYIYRAFLSRNRIGAYSVALILGVLSILILTVMELINRFLVHEREDESHVNPAA